jgi:hypothetical protein
MSQPSVVQGFESSQSVFTVQQPGTVACAHVCVTRVQVSTVQEFASPHWLLSVQHPGIAACSQVCETRLHVSVEQMLLSRSRRRSGSNRRGSRSSTYP